MSNLYCTPLPFAQTQTSSAQPAGTSSAGKELTPDDRDAGFVADQGGTEQTSGELLLVEAYAAIWVLVFAMVFLSMRKQKALDARIDQLSRDLDKARAAGGGD